MPTSRDPIDAARKALDRHPGDQRWLTRELADALAADALTLFYQPVVSLESGAVLAVEALARWEHPRDGLLLASGFLGLAERSGLEPDLDRWAIDRACWQLAQWRELRGEASVPRVSVNLSADRLGDHRLIEEVAESLRRWGVRPGQLVLELHETPVLLTLPAAGRLAELRALGVRLLLDDFGTGAASLFALRRLNFDGIKVDWSFVADAATVAAARAAILDGMRRLSEGLALDMVVTGVETGEQLAELDAIGCRAVEGLGLLGPVPPETLMEVFELSRPRLTPAAAGFRDRRPRSADDEAMVTLSRAAAMLNISTSTLRRWADDGRVSAVRTQGGHRRFRPSELRRLASPREARVRVPAMPSRPLPAVSTLLAAEGTELASIAARALYDGDAGWFAGPAARALLERWAVALSDAFGSGRYDDLAAGTAPVMHAAAAAGATLAERHGFLERFAAALRRRLMAEHCPPDEQTGAARALAALAHHLLDAGAGSVSPTQG